jgi:DNA repair exonuclease SbcCD ATPase subunit
VRILEMNCQPVGPLTKPVLYLHSYKNCTVVFDENETGKTSLVDIIVNMLFKRGSAQSRFQSRRFDDYDGYVKLEYQGNEMTCTGSVDLDKNFGFPQEFSRLPIVRGSDLHFLWSGKREKKGPLIDACIQHFSADFEDNLSTVVANARSAAGLPAKMNYWTKGKLEEIGEQLDLYRKKEFLLSVMANKEKTTRELQDVDGKLRKVKETLAALTREHKELAGERQAALCLTAKSWERKLSALRAEYREGGYERCSREDLHLWAESAAVERSLREKEDSLKSQISETEKELFDVQQRQANVSRSLKEAEEAYNLTKETLSRLRQEKEEKGRVRSDLMAETRTLLNSARSADAQRNRTKWALAVGALLVVAAAALFIAGQLLPGGFLLIGGLAIFGWALSVFGICGRTVREAEEKIRHLTREAGLQPAGTLDEVAVLLTRHFQKQDDLGDEALVKAELECQEKGEKLQKFVQESLLCEREQKRFSESLREFRSSLLKCTRELDSVKLTLEDLMRKTGKPDRGSLEDAIKDRERMEREIEKAVTRLGTLLGSEEEWRERLFALEPHLERYPAPRPLQELDQQKGQLEAKLQESRRQEDELQRYYEQLRRQELEEAQSLYAAGCGDVATLALRLKKAEQVLKGAIRESLAAIWVQQVVEAAKEGVEEILLEPLARAGEIFYQITGRYDTLNYARQDGDIKFSVSEQETTYSEDLLSDGARAQLLISLRLALLETILGEEPGFLVLDDPLLSSSETRKRNAIKVLLDYVRKGWQVFYLTVDSVAVEIFRECGKEVVEFKKVSDFYQ